MNVILDKDILAANWNDMKRKVQLRWGRLSNEQLDRISGNYDELTRLIRERYGYTKEKTHQELDEFIERLDLLERQP